MKSTLKKLPKSIIELTIEESSENIAKQRKSVISNLKKNSDIKGFRKGANIPEDFIVKHYGEEQITSMTVERAIDVVYQTALKENNIIPVSQAKIKEIISQNPLKIKIDVEVFPEVEIDSKYKKIKVKKTKVTVSKKEVDDALEEIQTKFTKFEKVEEKNYKIKSGDKVFIDTEGYDKDGKILENTSMKNYPIVIGTGVLVPGFEDGLIGAEQGNELKLDITFPDDYHNETFKGQKTKFEVKINEIEKSKKPEFTEEFIKQLRGQEVDFEGFKKILKSEIQETKESNARLDDENKLMEELLKVATLDLGESILANQVEKVFLEAKERITQNGGKMPDYLESMKISEEEYKEKSLKPIAIKRLQSELILHKLGEIEKIELSDEEIKKEIKEILKKFGSEDVQERLKELYKEGTKHYEELKARMSYRKLIDSFFEETK